MSKKRQKSAAESAANNTIQFDPQRTRRTQIIPRNRIQEDYLELLLDDSKCIVYAIGPAGTGKTLFSMQAGVRALQNNQVDRLILTRPAVGVEGEDHGFLPGDLNEKMAPWTLPLFDVLKQNFSPREIERLIEEETIELAPLMFMRGRNFHRCWVVADEMQNATPAQMKMLLTRIGANSKIVITGDLAQTDRRAAQNGLLDFCSLIRNADNCKYVAGVEFSHCHIERHPAVAEILRIYGDVA